jgi:hypothetical protein
LNDSPSIPVPSSEGEVDPLAVGLPAPDIIEPSRPQASPEPNVLKTIRKSDFQLLCHQHNPATAEAKKQRKADGFRSALAALPPMARIKVRVSAGVFEVTLVRVREEFGSVEVIWDKGVKREFKFSSVVLGEKGGEVVGQKPTEIAPEPQCEYRKSVLGRQSDDHQLNS